jgi:hypothetical protein
MTASALNPTPWSEPHPAARTLSVSRAILYATLVVGVLDAADGVVFRGLQGQNPIQVLQYIASSLLGALSFSGGLASAGLGLVVHFAIALVVATIYILASRRVAVFAYAMGTPGTAVWRCSVGSDEPGGVAAHRGCLQPDHDCGVGQRRHGSRSVRRPAQRVLCDEGGGGLNGLSEKQATIVLVHVA